MLGRIIGVLVVGGVGIVLVVIGLLIWKQEEITLMHDYHVNKVSEENKKAFCTLSGSGLAVIGVGALGTAVIFGITESLRSFVCFAVCFAAGLTMMIAAVRKYNR